MNKSQKKVLNYYQSLESRLGYKYVTKETKHFGYYPEDQQDISEEVAQQLMSNLVAKNLQLQPNQRVLDAGCGYGVTSVYLTKKYSVAITGIDLNEYEIVKATQAAKKLGLENTVDFKIMDYSETTFTGETFDSIFTLETLSHASNLQKTLQGFLNILKPKGKIALFEYTLAPETEFSPRELQMLNIGIEGTAALGLKEFRHNQFVNYLQAIGFRNVREENITQNMLPSLYRLKRIARVPYFFVKLSKLQKYFVNTTIAAEWYELMRKDLIRYCIFTGEK